MLIELFFDREFRDYNFREIPNRGSPSEDQLFDLVDKARNGDRSAFLEFGDIMYWTLRKPAYECYQAECGPEPISYGDYFYAKLQVFLDVLVYEETYHSRDWDPAGSLWEGRTALRSSGPEIYPGDVQELLVPADSERLNWVDLVQVVSIEKHDRLAALRGWLRKHAQPKSINRPDAPGLEQECRARSNHSELFASGSGPAPDLHGARSANHSHLDKPSKQEDFQMD